MLGKKVFVTLIDMHYLSEMLRAGLGFLIGLKGKCRMIRIYDVFTGDPPVRKIKKDTENQAWDLNLVPQVIKLEVLNYKAQFFVDEPPCTSSCPRVSDRTWALVQYIAQ